MNTKVVKSQVLLEVCGLTLERGGKRVLSDISFSLRTGEFLGVIGPNGGGKTTLLRVLLGLQAPSAGRLQWIGRREASAEIGYVPQRVDADPQCPFCAAEVVEMGNGGPRPLFGARCRENREKAGHWMQLVGLSESRNKPFLHLSGGQQRRLLLARALMNSPDVLLLDEPTAGVDAEGQEQFLQVLGEVSREGVAIVLVSHDLPVITARAHTILYLDRRVRWHGAARAFRADDIMGDGDAGMDLGVVRERRIQNLNWRVA